MAPSIMGATKLWNERWQPRISFDGGLMVNNDNSDEFCADSWDGIAKVHLNCYY